MLTTFLFWLTMVFINTIILFIKNFLKGVLLVDTTITTVKRSRSLVLCSFFAALIAVGAFIKVPVPLVPFTLQFLFTTLAGLLLGKRLGALSVLLYIGIGLAGVPIFASGGGFSYILNPTFGYLLGFALGTYITGWIAESFSNPGFKQLLIAALAGLAGVYILGMLYYYFIANFYLGTPIGAKALVLYCFILAVPGDIFLCYVSALVAKKIRPVLLGRD